VTDTAPTSSAPPGISSVASVTSRSHLARLPHREGEQAERDAPEEHWPSRPVGDGLQGAGLVHVGAPQPPGQPHRQVADEEVHDAVGDQPHPGDVGQDRMVGDLTGTRDDVVRPVQETARAVHA
jgi:hypothetical protein